MTYDKQYTVDNLKNELSFYKRLARKRGARLIKELRVQRTVRAFERVLREAHSSES